MNSTVYVLQLLNELPDHWQDIDAYESTADAWGAAHQYMEAHKAWDLKRMRPPPFPREVRVIRRSLVEEVIQRGTIMAEVVLDRGRDE